MQTEIIKNTAGDVPEMMRIYSEARRAIARFGIDQWQNGYPEEHVIAGDVSLGRSYSLRCGGEICALFAVIDDGEPTYDVIYGGNWLTGPDGRYLAIHRVAVSDAARGQGLSKAIFGFAEELARKDGFDSVRIDTHEGNLAMRHALEKYGFSLCGRIHLANGDPRVAYEKVLTS